MNESQLIARGAIYNANGDITKVSFEETYRDVCSTHEECIAKYGGMEEDSEW